MFYSGKRSEQVVAALLTAAAWVFIGTAVFHHMEPWTWIEALYFSVATLTTIGYGDLHPTTDAARLVDVFYILFGVIAVVSAIGIIGNYRIDKRAEKMKFRKYNKQKLKKD